jgi:hypothetical protein
VTGVACTTRCHAALLQVSVKVACVELLDATLTMQSVTRAAYFLDENLYKKAVKLTWLLTIQNCSLSSRIRAARTRRRC